MIDRNGVLPQVLNGGHSGLPCVRWRPRGLGDGVPEAGLDVPPEKGSFLPGGKPDTRPEHTAFSGTETMQWRVARCRSTGCLTPGSTCDKVLKLRNHRDSLDPLVSILMAAAPMERNEPLRSFPQPFNPHRQVFDSRGMTDEDRRRKVLKALQNNPLASVSDLARCSPRRWTGISRDLGGVSFGDAMRHMMKHVQENMSPLERASFWASVGPRQRVVDHTRVCGFAGDVPRKLVGF